MRGDTGYNDLDGGPGDDWVSFATVTPSSSNAFGLQLQLIAGAGNAPHRPEGDDAVKGIENVIGTPFPDGFVEYEPTGGVVRGRGWQPNALGRKDVCNGFGVVECDAGRQAEGGPIVLPETREPDPGLWIIGTELPDSIAISSSATEVQVSSHVPITTEAPCTGDGTTRVVCPSAGATGYLTVWGGSGDDTVEHSGSPGPLSTVRIDGGPGSDVLRGGPGEELLDAGGESLPYTRSDDVVLGGGGDDALTTMGAGGEVFRGGPGSDQLVSNGWCDVMDGGPGGSDIAGFFPSDALRIQIGGRGSSGGRGRCIRVETSIEILEGSPNDDVLVGSNGADPLIIGHAGDDVLAGRGGNDRLRGDEGKDRILGGGGRDVLEAADGQRDARLDCGAGGGRAVRDRHDPQPRNCGR